MAKLILLTEGSNCRFCGTAKIDPFNYGPLYQLGDIVAHYYCVLLSTKMVQRGRDHEGILGFLAKDIKKESERSLRRSCSFCGKIRATIFCKTYKCKRVFHLPCGLKNGSLHQFFGNFKSYCVFHRPTQIVPREIVQEALDVETLCSICYEELNVEHNLEALWAPCCLKTWFHRICVQKLAYSAGYFFKCPICSDTKEFQKTMQQFGIYIPQQDASWELEPNAYQELLYRYGRCDAENCKCPYGRKKNAYKTRWEIILCESCGSQGIHISCGNLKFSDPKWECLSCSRVMASKNLPIKGSEGEEIKIEEGSSKIAHKTLPLNECMQKKRTWVPEEEENSVLDKRKRVKIFCEQIQISETKNTLTAEISKEEESSKDNLKEEDRSPEFIDVETVDTKLNTQVLDVHEVLSRINPGPLSHKLSLIRDVLKEPLLEPKEKNNTEVKSDRKEPEVIILDDDSDIEIIEDKTPISHSPEVVILSDEESDQPAVKPSSSSSTQTEPLNFVEHIVPVGALETNQELVPIGLILNNLQVPIDKVALLSPSSKVLASASATIKPMASVKPQISNLDICISFPTTEDNVIKIKECQ